LFGSAIGGLSATGLMDARPGTMACSLRLQSGEVVRTMQEMAQKQAGNHGL